jgi:hypothetical protein
MKITRAFAIGLACIIALDAYRFSLGFSLRHPGELFFPIEAAAILAFCVIPLGIAIRALVCSISALIKKNQSPKAHFLTFLALIAALFLPSLIDASFYKAGVKMRIRLAGETAYLSLAHAIRATQQNDPSLFKKSDELAMDESYEAREQRKLKFLQTALPANSPAADQWPRSMLHVSIEATHIRIDRGSGMLGLVGVVILDQATTLKQYSDEELAENPYLPRYSRITDRLYMFESD